MSNEVKNIIEQLNPCPQCGSGDITWCIISHRPYCRECNNWGAINFGSDEDAIRSWNRKINHHIIHNSTIERDEALARFMGYTYIAPSKLAQSPDNKGLTTIPDFSTPDGFFKLWNYTSTKDWFFDFKFWFSKASGEYSIDHKLINPDVFANELLKYIKKRINYEI